MEGRLLLVLVLATLAGISSGCGDSQPAPPPTIPVTGTVTLDGSPLEGASVVFSDGVGITALGETDAAGRFALKTRFNSGQEAEGAPPRKYRVTIKKLIPPKGMSEDEYVAMRERYRDKVEKGEKTTAADRVPPKIQLIPRKYSSPMETVLEVTVKPGDNRDFPFMLEK